MTDAATDTPRRIVVVGGGIGGAEAALTMARGLPNDTVELVGRWPSIRLLPDLVYVPFGVSPRRIDIDVSELAPFGVRARCAEVTHVDVESRVLRTEDGDDIPFDILVAAPGAQLRELDADGLRSLDDAQRIGAALADIESAARLGTRRTVTMLVDGGGWNAPACELTALLAVWLRERGLSDAVRITYATADHTPFGWFGADAERAVDDAFRDGGVEVLCNEPPGRLDGLRGDLTVSFGSLEARSLPGLPGRNASGWYAPADDFAVAPNVFVVGDALDRPYRGGFATAWQARRVLQVLGGALDALPDDIDGIPRDQVEYQMDLGTGVLRARVSNAEALGRSFLGHDADVTVVDGGWPDKLAGLLLRELVVSRQPTAVDTPRAWRDELHQEPPT